MSIALRLSRRFARAPRYTWLGVVWALALCAPSPALATYLDDPIGPADLDSLFVVTPGMVSAGDMRALHRAIGVSAVDAQRIGDHWGTDTPAFYRDPVKRSKLIACGLDAWNWPVPTMTNLQYRQYLSVLFDPAYVCGGALSPTRHMVKKQMFLLENQVFNLRNSSATDQRWLNRFSIHREADANQRMFDHIHIRVIGGVGGRAPMRSEPVTCTELGARFNPAAASAWDQAYGYVRNHLMLSDAVSRVVANQFATPPADASSYGFRAFIKGTVACTDPAPAQCNGHAFYAEDLRLRPELQGWLTATGNDWTNNLAPLSCFDFTALVERMVAWEYNGVTFNSTADGQLQVFELQDFLLAVGNALINNSSAPFADLLHPDDVTLLTNDVSAGRSTEHIEMDFVEAVMDDMNSLLP